MTTADPIRPPSISSPISRPMRGSRIDVFYGTGPQSAAGDSSLPALSSLDSAFQLQEYISLVIRKDVHNVDRIVSIPILPGKEDGKGVDENCWIYEQLRRLAQDLTHPLITALQTECTRQTCPQMKAGEWLYLCVAHGNESTSFSSSSSDTGLPGGGMVEQCCAIDYILHTIDSATALLNSPRTFPSRLSIPTPSVRHFSSLARRLGRVFAHAYFHHRELFEQAEAESSLYRRFEEMVGRWSLVPKEFLVIPTLGKDNDTSRDGYARGRDDAGMTASEPKLEAAAVNLDVHLANASVPLLDSGFSSPAGTGRKLGRTRTDTMVLSDASTFVDELSKSPGGRAQPPELSSEETPAASSESSSEEESSESPAETTISKPEEVPAPIEPVVPVPEEPEIVAEEEEKQEHVEPEVTPSSSTAPSDSAPVDMKIEVAGEEVDGDDGEVQEEASASLPSDIKEEDKTPAVELDTAEDKKDSSEVEQTSEKSQINEPTMEALASSTEPAVSENVDTTDSLEEKNDTNEESEGDVQAKGEVGVTHEAKDAEVVGEAEEVASKGADGAEEEE
ncbi:mps one binder kinase activator-like 4 [Lentinula raphanica]|nr:mps one binder kinase activator-like 4 [Lentinula raphanica]